MRKNSKKKSKNKGAFEPVVLLALVLFQCILSFFSTDPIGVLIQVLNGGMFSLLLVGWMQSSKNN